MSRKLHRQSTSSCTTTSSYALSSSSSSTPPRNHRQGLHPRGLPPSPTKTCRRRSQRIRRRLRQKPAATADPAGSAAAAHDKTRRRRRIPAAAAQNPTTKTAQFFLRLRRYRLRRPRLHHDRLPRHQHPWQHYSNTSAKTPVSNVCIVTCIHATPTVTAGGKRGTRRGRSHRSYVSAMIRRN